MTLVERYLRNIGTITESQTVLKAELAELIVEEALTRDERKYMNHLMDLIGYNNTCLSIAERVVKELERKEKNELEEGEA